MSCSQTKQKKIKKSWPYRDSNPRLLGGKQECVLCAINPPGFNKITQVHYLPSTLNQSAIVQLTNLPFSIVILTYLSFNFNYNLRVCVFLGKFCNTIPEPPPEAALQFVSTDATKNLMLLSGWMSFHLVFGSTIQKFEVFLPFFVFG